MGAVSGRGPSVDSDLYGMLAAVLMFFALVGLVLKISEWIGWLS